MAERLLAGRDLLAGRGEKDVFPQPPGNGHAYAGNGTMEAISNHAAEYRIRSWEDKNQQLDIRY